MEKTIKVMESSDLFNKVRALPLLATEQAEVAGAVKGAEKLANALYWAVEKIGQFTTWLNPHPKFKPE
jgi:hypothetical protein